MKNKILSKEEFLKLTPEEQKALFMKEVHKLSTEDIEEVAKRLKGCLKQPPETK